MTRPEATCSSWPATRKDGRWHGGRCFRARRRMGRRRPRIPHPGLTTVVALALTVAACGEAGEEPSPRPLGEATDLPGSVAPPEEQARVMATNPRLLLFDVQTALESVRETRGSYPSVQ